MKEFNPERNFFSQSEIKLSESQEALYPLLVPENEKRAIKMDDFRDLYDVDKDTSYVQEMEARFAKQDAQGGVSERSKKAGRLGESIINYGIDKGGFLGQNARAIVASRYDDIHAGIDSFVEFEDEGMTSHIALGVDVTRNPEDLAKKFDKIRSSIDQGELSSAKYFKSGNFRGELRHVIRVVVGADQSIIDSISDLIVKSIRLRKSIKQNNGEQDQSSSAEQLKKQFEKNSLALEKHQLQWILLLEVKPQIEATLKRAERIKKRLEELGDSLEKIKKQELVVDECEKILGIINDIIKNKKSEGQSPDEEVLLNDRVYQLIQQEVKSF